MKIDLTGYNLDNLIKTLHVKKIKLFNVQKTDRNKLTFEILDKDFKKVKRHIANYKIKQTLSIFKRIPQILFNNLGVIIGCCVGLVFGVFASHYTWQIYVYGTEELSKTEILQVLKQNGIKTGKINTQTSGDIEEILLNNYDRIAQVSVIKQGTAIIINLSEKLVYQETEFAPIKVNHAGIIKEINVITGTVNVKVGDYVNVGDILVLPFNIDANGEKVSVKPLAEIKAEMFVVEKCELKRFEQVLVETGRTKKIYKYKFKNFNLFSGKSKNSFALFKMNMYNENISGLIPLNRDVIVYHELKTQQVEHVLEQERETLALKSQENALKKLPVGEILNEQTETNIIDDVLYAITTVTVFGTIT